MKTTNPILSRLVSSVVVAAALSAAGMSGAQAAAVTCGDLSLGTDTVAVDPALVGGLCYAGLTNLGNGALEDFVSSLLPGDAWLLDRDISGVGGQTGDWELAPSVWADSNCVFLYFHFGDANDEPGPTSDPDPDIFIVELASADTSADWTFGGGKLTGRSNIGLLGTGTDGEGPPSDIPEPGVLFLMGAGLLGLGMARCRKSA